MSAEVTIPTELGAVEVAQIETELSVLETIANGLAIVDHAGLESAGEILRDTIKPYEAHVHESCDPICDMTNKAHMAATKQRREFLAPAEKAKNTIQQKMQAWTRAERRRIAEEAEKLEAKRQAEIKKAREEQEAEAKKLRDAQAEQVRKLKAERDRLAAEEEKKRMAHAAEVEAAGDKLKAEEIRDTPAPPPDLPEPETFNPYQKTYVPPPPAQPERAPKAKSVTEIVKLRGAIGNGNAFLGSLASGTIPRTVIKLVQAELDKFVNSYPAGEMSDEQWAALGITVTEVSRFRTKGKRDA